ncbi:hypothetical protein MMYC01_200071 [Madurella mycetomatis]|uniref:Uncharacterized protein n=1 Tax=Madurella mycetomatis TaxID=100816 RepID=A0A150AT25_9PEZI|nr:hypothetical protein MMYC01_200071 [Madurella mycetomatis]
MSRWFRLSRAWCVIRPVRVQSRLLSTRYSTEYVRVPCASSGEITISLHNVSQHHPATPLAIFIPPFSHAGAEPAVPLPASLLDHPTAVINYRWQPHGEHDRPEIPLQWPTPIHDVLFGYSWLLSNLGTANDESPGPRSAYIYGSYLGASLAAGLALTESHLPDPPRRMTVRGLVAHNGIYNWTMFLPDHPIHKTPRSTSKADRRAKRRRGLLLPLDVFDEAVRAEPEDDDSDPFTLLQHQTPLLFSSPADLFDPFASACLFFHTPNLHVPDDFTTPLSASSSTLPPEWTQAIDIMSSFSPSSSPSSSPSNGSPESESEPDETADELLAKAAQRAKQQNPPRKGYFRFPPRQSTLRLPETLLLYDDAVASRKGKGGNSFKLQATELASVMRRSLGMAEFRQRMANGGEDEFADLNVRAREAERRVQLAGVGGSADMEGGLLGLDEEGEEVVGEWLRDRIDEERM